MGSAEKGRGTDTSASFGIPVAVSFGEREWTGEVGEEGRAGAAKVAGEE